HYLKKHEYACASSHHLWEALESVSSLPVTKMMKSWIEQPGFPIVEVKREGNSLTLTQKRFTFLPQESDQEWLIPLHIKAFFRNGDSKTITTLLDTGRKTLDLGDGVVSYKVNHGQTGFYRVKYLEEGNLKALGDLVEKKDLGPEDRWGLQNDLYALVKRGDISIDDYLDFLSHYAYEDAFLPMISISDNLFHAYLVMEGARKGKVASLGRSLFEQVLSDMGYEPRSEEKHTMSILRDHILWVAALFGSDKASEFAMGKFHSLMRGDDRIHPDILRSVMQVGALKANQEAFEWLDKRLQTAESEHERMNILVALGSFREPSMIKTVQQYILEKVPARNQFVPIGCLATNPHAIPHMWEWYLSHLGELEQFHPMHYERVIAAIIPFCGMGREEEVKSFCDEHMKRKEKSRDVIKLSLERLEINSRMRAAHL
ncbi:MAG: M1 family metallopeptidase, partial [Pseudomonadota bacterium]